MISHRLWRLRFNGDANILGKPITIQDTSFNIVGVMPLDFRGQSGTVDAWICASEAKLMVLNSSPGSFLPIR